MAFNLYYRALKGTRHKWLDIVALSRAVLPSTCNVIRVNYYTARVSGRTNPDSPKRQACLFARSRDAARGGRALREFHDEQQVGRAGAAAQFQAAVALPAGRRPMSPMCGRSRRKAPTLISGCTWVRDACMGASTLRPC